MAIKSMLDIQSKKDSGIKKESFWGKVDKAATGFLDTGLAALELPAKVMDKTPLPKLGAGLVGTAGRLIGGAVGAAGSLITQVNPGPEAVANIKRTAEKTGSLGEEIGNEGVRQGPLAVLTGALAPETTALSTRGELKSIAVKIAEQKAKRAAIKAVIKDKKNAQTAVELAQPILNKGGAIEAVKPRVVDGKVVDSTVPQTNFKGAELVPTKRINETAEVLLEVLGDDVNKSAGANLPKVKQAIVDKAEAVQAGLAENKAITNKRILRKFIEPEDLPLELKGDPLKSFNEASEKFFKFYDAEPKTLDGLMEARKKFDAFLSEQLKTIWDDPGSRALNRALRDMRLKVNDYIASNLGDDAASAAFKKSLHEQNLLYEAVDTLAEKVVTGKPGGIATGEFKTGKVQQKASDIFKKTKKAAIVGGSIGAFAAGVKSLTK